jgi:hypothetical protein
MPKVLLINLQQIQIACGNVVGGIVSRSKCVGSLADVGAALGISKQIIKRSDHVLHVTALAA